MQVFIMRHGEAEGFLTPSSTEDSQRALTSEGQAEAKIMATWFAKNKIEAKHVFVSPYLRAQQTCEIITASMKADITTLNFISPLDEAKPVHDFIDGWLSDYVAKNSDRDLDNESIIFVSHMPLVCFLVAELTQPHNAPIFSTGSVAQIDYDIAKMKGVLVALTSPIEVS